MLNRISGLLGDCTVTRPSLQVPVRACMAGFLASAHRRVDPGRAVTAPRIRPDLLDLLRQLGIGESTRRHWPADAVIERRHRHPAHSAQRRHPEFLAVGLHERYGRRRASWAKNCSPAAGSHWCGAARHSPAAGPTPPTAPRSASPGPHHGPPRPGAPTCGTSPHPRPTRRPPPRWCGPPNPDTAALHAPGTPAGTSLAVTSSTPSPIPWTKIRSLQKSGGTSPVASIPHDSPGVRPANPPAGSSPQRRPKTFAPAIPAYRADPEYAGKQQLPPSRYRYQHTC